MIDPKTFNEEARAKKEEVAADESDDEKDKDKEEKKPCKLLTHHLTMRL